MLNGSDSKNPLTGFVPIIIIRSVLKSTIFSWSKISPLNNEEGKYSPATVDDV